MVASNIGTQFGDTSQTKIFVGGLPWETKTDTMRRYFEQFGEILEAVVISDKVTGRSKGYGFVTFKDPESAARACENGSPVIDGRRANCNLAALGAQKTHTTKIRQTQEFEGVKKLRTSSGPIISSSTYLHPQYNPQYSLPYSIYRSPYYQQGNFAYPVNCNGYAYGGGGHGQHYSNYPAGVGSPNSAGVYYSSYYPLYFYPVQPPRPISVTAESVTGKHRQLPPRIHRLKLGTEQVACQNPEYKSSAQDCSYT